MSVVISEGQVLGALMKYIHERLARELDGIKRGLDQPAYMRCCGRIEAAEGILAEARDLIKKSNNGLSDDEEETV